MSINNPYSVGYGWKVDPDGRQDRSSGPCTTRQLTPEEKKKYGIVRGEDENMTKKGIHINELDDETKQKVIMAAGETPQSSDQEIMAEPPVSRKLSKVEVIRLAGEGKNLDEIADIFSPTWNGKLSLLKAKIVLYISNKAIKPRGPAKKKAAAKTETTSEKRAIPEEVQPEQINNADLPDIMEPEKYPDLKNVTSDLNQQISEDIKNLLDSKLDETVDHPSHYTAGSIEVIDIIESICKSMSMTPFEGFCIGCVVKYLARWKNKGGLEDLRKARWYLNRIIGAEVV